MIIHPRIWGFLCTTAHPLGCEKNVQDQIEATTALGVRHDGPKNVLIIGASTGYGLAARITAAFGFGAATLGVFSETPSRGKRTASAGWYNAAAFQQYADNAGLKNLSLNADAFSHQTRSRTIELIREHLGGAIDLVIYSLAAPSRRLPDSGERVNTVLKPIGDRFRGPTIDTDRDTLKTIVLEPATAQEITDTTAVMGGEDWGLWMQALADADVLSNTARTVAFSYIGPELTWPIYRHGTIGHAKEHLKQTAKTMCARAGDPDFAHVAVLKSIVTQASAAIPVIPLYLSLVYKVMKEKALHETAIDQQNRLFRDQLYPGDTPTDKASRWRLDDRELRADVQNACKALWPTVAEDNLFDTTDYAGYKHDFLNLFGFDRDDVDYDMHIEAKVGLDCDTL